jgi:hypothetical protein
MRWSALISARRELLTLVIGTGLRMSGVRGTGAPRQPSRDGSHATAGVTATPLLNVE